MDDIIPLKVLLFFLLMAVLQTSQISTVILPCYAQLHFGQWLTAFMRLEPKYSPNDVVFILI